MKTMLIGNDISFRWDVREKGGSQFDLEGKEVALYRKGFSGNVRIGEVSVKGNVVSWSWPGRDQKSPGTYSFLLVVNEGGDGMHSLDTGPAVTLVSSPGERCRVGFPDKEDLEGILNDYLQAVDKANEAAGEAIRAANEAIKAISSMESALDSIKKLLSSGSVYIGVLESGGKIPEADSNVFMLCGPGEYSVDGSPAEVGIGQLGILSNASGQWEMDIVQVVEVLQEVDSDSAQTSTNPASVSATMKFLDSYLKPGNLASIIPDWGGFFSKIDDIGNITGPLDFSETNYLTKEENLKDACMQLDEEVKASNDNIAILGAEADNLAETKQDKLAAGTGIAIQGNVISCTLDTSVFVVKESLPEQPDSGKENKIYVVPNPDGQGDNIYDEYAWVDGKWEKLGSFKASVNLSAYQTKQDDSLKTEAKTVAGAINELHADKLDVNNYFSKIGSSAMRPVYEACGAVWNAETGYYELNGLTDITEEDILNDWLLSYGIFPNASYRGYKLKRTNFPPVSYMQVYYGVEFSFSLAGSDAEVFNLWPLDVNGGVPDIGNRDGFFFPLRLNSSFNSNRRLREILGFIDMSRCTVRNRMSFALVSPELREIRILNLDNNINFASDSPLLSYESVKCLVDNAATTAPRTVTIGPVTYSYLSGSAQPSADVGGTTEEWQALMTAAAGKQISFATEE